MDVQNLHHPDQSIFTIAAGKPIYWQMAINLARSFLYWNWESHVRFRIVTDLDEDLPLDLGKIEVQRVPLGSLGVGFSSKLQLDKLVFTQQTLFIDADCLCFGSLGPIFTSFAGRPVAVVGGAISEGEWFGDVAGVLGKFGLKQMPKFNGGIYYLEKGAVATSVYARARELEKEYDALGLGRLRGRPNDELLMALSMGLHGLSALSDNGAVMGDLFSCPDMIELDVLRGAARVSNPPAPNANHQSWFPVGEKEPIVVHFLGDYTRRWQYLAEVRKLELVMNRGWSESAASCFVTLGYSIWQRLASALKDWLRPLYHSLFGARAVAPSPRV